MRYAAPSSASGEAAQNQLQSVCALATWRLARGDYRYAEAAIRRLRGTVVTGLPPGDSIAVSQYTALCAALLEASRAEALHLPNARTALELADTAARTYDVGASLGANLVVARIAEAQGNLRLALKAVRRRAAAMICFPPGISRPSCTRRAASPRSPATPPALSGHTSTTLPFDRIQNRR